MSAPIDIVIDIIKGHLRKLMQEIKCEEELSNYGLGQKDAYEGLIQEFEGFKKLFN